MITGNCDSCGYFTEVKVSETGPPANREALLCDICSSTLIGKAHFWPQKYMNESRILQTIGWIGNRLIEEIRKSCAMGRIPK